MMAPNHDHPLAVEFRRRAQECDRAACSMTGPERVRRLRARAATWREAAALVQEQGEGNP
jgi:hypothetical protein